MISSYQESSASSAQTLRQSTVLDVVKMRDMKSPSPESAINQTNVKIDNGIIKVQLGSALKINMSP